MSLGCSKRILAGSFFFVVQALPLESSLSQQPEPSPAGSSRQDFVGDEACRACHSGKAAGYSGTAHHATSGSPTSESILGSFAEEKNILRTSDEALYFRMDRKPDGFYQTAVWGIPPATTSRSEKMAVVIGSGRKGQTYLYWRRDQLFQLPVSYWTDLATWINSPGYRDGEANFERRVISNCLGCHLTYAEAIGSPVLSNQFKPESLVFGISCERCHGAGREHVEAMQSNQQSATKIINPAKLTRDGQINVCAQCHGGLRAPLTDPFSYVPGESLDKYFRKDLLRGVATADVHGNQVALLESSRCYRSSPGMSCSTCHDAHQTQRDPVALSSRCLACHRAEACGEFPVRKEKLTGHCVDCHMPVEPSNVIISNQNTKPTRAMVRSHWIKVYPDRTRSPAPNLN